MKLDGMVSQNERCQKAQLRFVVLSEKETAQALSDAAKRTVAVEGRTIFFTLLQQRKPVPKRFIRSIRVISRFRDPLKTAVLLETYVPERSLLKQVKLVRKPGLVPGPSASRAELLLLQHNHGNGLPSGAVGADREDPPFAHLLLPACET